MTRPLHKRFTAPSVFLFFAAAFAPANFAQDAKPVDRIYMHPQIEVQKALDSMNAFATDRLPTLEGFVDANAATLDHFENPHFQLHIDVESQGTSQTLVTVSAKITAWYLGQSAGQSQYVVIPSNGRLENDFLDRLSIYLEKGGFSGAPTSGPNPSSSSSAPPTSDAGAPVSAPSPGAAAPPPAAPAADPPLEKSNDPAVLASEIAGLRAQREAIEAQQRKTQQQISELTAISKNQNFLSSIAIIRSSQTPVFSAPDETSKIIFHADADDEFEAIEAREGFLHVKLEGGSSGWIRGSQLRRASDPDEDSSGNSNFSTANDEVKPFEGDWAPLKGKPTLFVFAQPVRSLPEGTLGQSQLEFAKEVFVDGYREANHTDQPAEGVVVVFLGEKGGVAAASLDDIRRWHDGFLTDKVFLERCSFDPPDSFRDAVKR